MAPDPRHRLLLIRHAKAETASPSQADHERPLTPAGRRAAEEVAESLAGEALDLVLCSSARRAVETLACLSPLLARTRAVSVEHALYRAGSAELLERLHEVAAYVKSVAVVGHNPALHELATRLAAEGEQEDMESLARSLRPAGVAALDLGAMSWSELGEGGGRLALYRRPG
jgi:phosphohistidine phosphatase